jgi:hypothetical protein
MGGGSLDLLLAMLDGAQAPETPPTEAASPAPGSPTWVPEDYRLERSPDVLSLRRADGSFVAVFSAQGATKEAVMRAVEEDREGLPAYFGPEEYADSARRLVETRRKHSWERFLRTERRVLEARRNGWMAKALARTPEDRFHSFIAHVGQRGPACPAEAARRQRPIGFNAAGLPMGMQIVGPQHRDDLVLQAAYAFEQARPWHPHWPLRG